ncbi:MAG: serine hydrolase [Ornithinibacter sp.]
MEPAAVERRRLFAGGGAAVGLALLSGCAPGGASGRGSALSTRTADIPAIATGTPTPRAMTPPGALLSPTLPTDVSVDGARLVEAPRLADRVEDLMERRGGSLSLELVDLRRGHAFRVDRADAYCFSTIKVLILVTLLRQLSEDGSALTEQHRDLAERMITRSENSAAEALLDRTGRDEVQRVARLIGMDHTEIDSGWWGLWRTQPGDLGRMVDAVLSSERVLDGAGRCTARFLMAGVLPSQRWGVFSAEQHRGVYVAGKNGWGPLPDGYRVNSTGWVSGERSEYVLSILSRSPRGFTYGRDTVGQVAALCHDAAQAGLS